MRPHEEHAELRLALHAEGRDWWVCRCGRPLDKHSRRKVPNAGIDEYTCADTVSGVFESETLPELAYVCGKGVHIP